MLHGKKVLIGITGSIAAYKSAILTRLLVKAGAEVQIVMTPSAKKFITPLTLSTLSKQPVYSDFVKNESGEWTNHVELGLWADVFLIAPATANTIAKMANGICDNLLLAVYLSARSKVVVAPAMDLDMYVHPATKKNMSTLRSFDNEIIESNFGELASGLHGDGRMAEPEEIVDFLEGFFLSPLKGKKALVTAGPTHEALDPVRFIGNHSTGKMAFAIASELARQGATVTLVAGPTRQSIAGNIEIKLVTSAEEMFEVTEKHFIDSDIIVHAAAVADYRPAQVQKNKIKKQGDSLELKLIKTRDIAAELGLKKKSHQYVVGFALETNDEVDNAKDKLKRKNFDLIVLNSLNDKGAGFGYDTNKVTLLDKDNKSTKFELKSKRAVARDIVQYILTKIDV